MEKTNRIIHYNGLDGYFIILLWGSDQVDQLGIEQKAQPIENLFILKNYPEFELAYSGLTKEIVDEYKFLFSEDYLKSENIQPMVNIYSLIPCQK